MSPLLDVRGLQLTFDDAGRPLQVIHGLNLTLERGETLGIVGESGSGKSVTALMLMGLLPSPPALVQAECLRFDGRSLLRGSRLDPRVVESLRGPGMAMIFQDPSSSLNPVFPIGDILGAVLRQHAGARGTAVRERSLELLAQVGLENPPQVLERFPHQLSGGMKQRAAIAMALAARPALLIADEPTTALDATVQMQVLALLRDLQRNTGIAMIFISHDLGVVSRVCSRVAVMYAGRIVEESTVERLFSAPAHPYTRGLFAARPVLRSTSRENRDRSPLLAIPGAVPPPSQVPSGCAFHPRCRFATRRCAAEIPSLTNIDGEEGRVACFHPVLEGL